MLSDLYLRSISMRGRPLDERESYIFSLPVVRNLQTLRFHRPVTFLSGENGSGKSTLLEAIAIKCGFNPEGGSRNFSFSSSDTHSPLHDYLQVARGALRPKDGFFLRAESFYNLASEVERLDDPAHKLLKENYGGLSLHGQSHGESFLALMRSRFRGQGLYILDEPEAALSVTSQLAMLAIVHSLVSEHSQFLIATHSPILMAYPDADIYVLTEDAITPTPYQETDPYLLTKRFLNHPESMLREVLKEG